MTIHKEIISGLVLACMTLFAPGAMALDVQLPPETAAYRPSELPGYQLVQRNCMTCHSAQYVGTQPPTSPRAYWDATVKKMKKPFGAQFPDEDVPAIVDYLSKTYGAERTAAASGMQKTMDKQMAPAASSGSADAQALMATNNCMACHAIDKTVVGPAFKEVASRYQGKGDALNQVARNIRAGGAGKWGPVPMPPYDQLSEKDAQTLARYVLAQ
jgi:sulfite dehydrogenase